MKKHYTNATRRQIVEVINQFKNDELILCVWYKVVEGNKDNPIKEFACTKERFERNYV